MTRRLSGVWLGRRDYASVLGLQRRLAEAKRGGEPRDFVLFLEHEPVITLGSGAKSAHVLLDPEVRAKLGIELVKVGRGGDVTLHAPGQLVCYPILNLSPERQDVRRYVRDLTETMRRVVAEYGVFAGTHPEHVGLWADRKRPSHWAGVEAATEPAKIGAIGVSISRWVTMHGFALNLTTDLGLFDWIVPCGIREYGVTSVLELTGTPVDVRGAAVRALAHLAALLDADDAGLSEAPLEFTEALPADLRDSASLG